MLSRPDEDAAPSGGRGRRASAFLVFLWGIGGSAPDVDQTALHLLTSILACFAG
jgi:hypothetical protein